MFEKYTEKARRVIFFARYEASQFGSPLIEPEDLLLGILREDPGAILRFLPNRGAEESIREQLAESRTLAEKIAQNVDLPLSRESKMILTHAAEESDRLGHKHISPTHLLIGILRNGKCFAAEVLNQRGIHLELVREAARAGLDASRHGADRTSQLPDFGRNLTAEASEQMSTLAPDRGADAARAVEVLCRQSNNRVAIIGEAAVCETVLRALAQRIVDSTVPKDLEGVQLIVLDAKNLADLAGHRPEYSALSEAMRNGRAIVVLDAVSPLFSLVANENALGGFRIVTCTEAQYRRLTNHDTVLPEFTVVRPAPLSEGECRSLLAQAKESLQTFHGIEFDEAAIATAITLAAKGSGGEGLLAGATALLDAAASHARVSHSDAPEEVRALRRQINSLNARMEQAIVAHDFNTAKTLGEAERDERAKLRQFTEALGLNRPPAAVVLTRDDVERAYRANLGAEGTDFAP